MQKDIKKMMQNYSEENIELSNNHRDKFEDLLHKELHVKTSKKKPIVWLSIAASIALLVTVVIKFYPTTTSTEIKKDIPKEITLGSLSPELKTLESYYVNSINYEISNLNLNDNNKEILEGYLTKISELTTEYKSLTKELNTKGVNDEIINALINNLQLRLQLLQRLKKQLNNLKQLNLKQNETQQV